MAITFQKRQLKQRYLFVIYLILMAATFAVLYFGYFKKQTPSLPPPKIIYRPPEIEINFDALNNPFLKELLPYENIKPFAGKIGRENPFLPY